MGFSMQFHGANALCYLNGILVGRVSRFDYDYTVTVQEARGLDFPMPFELMPGMIQIDGTLKLFRLSGDGGTQGMGMLPQVNDFSRLKYATVTIVDRTNGTAFFKSDLVLGTKESWGVPAKGLVEGSLTFKAIAFSNEMADSNFSF